MHYECLDVGRKISSKTQTKFDPDKLLAGYARSFAQLACKSMAGSGAIVPTRNKQNKSIPFKGEV